MNFIINLFLLLLTSYVARKKIYPLRMIAGALTGSLSVFLIFFKINDIYFFLLKFLFAVLMIVTSNKATKKGYIKLITLFYLLSFCLSGVIFHLNNSFGDKSTLSYITISLSGINFLVLILLCVNSVRTRLEEKKLYKNVFITHNDKKITLKGYIDTGNNLYEPLSGLPVIIASKKEILKLGELSCIPLICHTISGNAVLQAFKPDKIIIEEMEVKAFVGISENMKNDNFSLLLNNDIWRFSNAS